MAKGATYTPPHYSTFSRTGNRNIFEEVIDELMLDSLVIPQIIKDKIRDMPLHKKRLNILSFLDEDRHLFTEIKAYIEGSRVSKMEHVLEVVEMLRTYVKVGTVEKKMYGEVMTPIELVDEMLDTLPDDVWSDPTLKWLDPANGSGTFPLVVIKRLMDGLKEWEPNDDIRYNHIIENMIYVCELQPKNMFLYLCLIDPFDHNTCNIYTGSFLDEGFNRHMKDVWEVDKFDIIIGNPPYQDINKTGDNKLYLSFIRKAFSLLAEDTGYLLYVTPKNTIDYILNIPKNRTYISNFYEIVYLAIDTPRRYFEVGSTFCYFLLRNRVITEDTQNINYEYLLSGEVVKSNITIYLAEKLPSILNEDTISISNKLKNKYTAYDIKKMTYIKNNRRVYRRIRKNFIKDGTISETKRDEYKYPIIEVINESNPYPGKLYYFTEEMDDMNERKVILSGKGYLCPSYCEGGYNLSDSMFYMKVNNENEYRSLKSIIESRIFKFIKLIYFSDDGFSSIKTFDKIGGLGLDKEWSDSELYNYYGFTESEIRLIEETIK